MISLIVFALATLAAAGPPASAGTVGVVVTGEAALQPPLVAQLEGWLRSHGHQVVALALDTAATTRLIDCLTVDDSLCARKVVEAQSRSDSIVFARLVREGTTINLIFYWIVKGRSPTGGRRGCEECNEDALRGASDELMNSLAPAATVPTGRLKLQSTPPGMIVMLDGDKIGVTPLERDLAAGAHEIVLIDGGTRVGERKVQVPAGATVEVTMPVVYPAGTSRTPAPTPLGQPGVASIALWTGGGLAIVTSIYMFYLGQQGGQDDPYVYPYATGTGVTLVGVGAAAIGAGFWLWLRGSNESRDSAPVAAIGREGSFFGWQGRF